MKREIARAVADGSYPNRGFKSAFVSNRMNSKNIVIDQLTCFSSNVDMTSTDIISGKAFTTRTPDMRASCYTRHWTEGV